MQIINDLLVKPRLQHQVTTQAVVKIQEKLPLVHKKVFAFELKANVEPSNFVVELMELYPQLNEQKKPSTFMSNSIEKIKDKRSANKPKKSQQIQKNMHCIF